MTKKGAAVEKMPVLSEFVTARGNLLPIRWYSWLPWKKSVWPVWD